MPRPPLVALLALFGATSALLAVDDCDAPAGAHARMLESDFEVERTFRMSVNGDLKKRELARLTFAAGALHTEVLDSEVLCKGLVFEGGGKDFAVDAKFDCARLERVGDGRYELTSDDGLEVVTFESDDERRAFRPVAWRLDTTERFLFKRFVIEGRAEYSGFRWK